MGTRNGDCWVMKMEFLALVLFALMFFTIPNSFAASITLDTNKDSYSGDDTIAIFGTVPDGIEGEPVAIEVKNSGGETIMVRSVKIGPEGSYGLSFKIPTPSQSGSYQIIVTTQVAGQTQSQSKNISFSSQAAPAETPTAGEGGGCLIATATYGSELAPQVQLLREIRDNKVLQTSSGASFMTGFNQIYYSFSPIIADYERENVIFKETVKIILTPLLISLSILNYVEIDSEEDILIYGIGLIVLNVGMYIVAPATTIVKLRSQLK